MGNKAYETRIDAYFVKLKMLSTRELARSAEELVAAERQHIALLIAHLAEFSQRKAHLELGYRNLFDYCVRHLHLSEGSVWMRLQVANVSRRFPQVLEALAEGKVSLSVAGLLASRLTEENVDELLSRSEGRTKREVEELLASLAPKPTVKPSIRKRKSTEESVASKETSGEHDLELLPALGADVPERSGKLELAAEQAFNFRFSADQAFREKLGRLGEVLGVHDPESNMAEVFERAMEFTLKRKDPQRKLERRKEREARREPRPGEVAAATDTASAACSPGRERRETSFRERSRYIPSAARERTLERAGYRCEYRAPDGTRCRARTLLEIDHMQPFGKGGGSGEDNLRVLCHGHNRLFAERAYGTEFIARRIKESQAAPRRGSPAERVTQPEC